jgi:hypothetical protein
MRNINRFSSIAFLTFSICLSILFISSCGTMSSTEDTIKLGEEIRDPQVSCLQSAIVKDTLFKSDFKYDNSFPPTITVYIKGEWNSLSDEEKEERLKDVGRKWHECNPNNTAQVTIFAYDINNMPILAVFVMKGE